MESLGSGEKNGPLAGAVHDEHCARSLNPARKALRAGARRKGKKRQAIPRMLRMAPNTNEIIRHFLPWEFLALLHLQIPFLSPPPKRSRTATFARVN